MNRSTEAKGIDIVLTAEEVEQIMKLGTVKGVMQPVFVGENKKDYNAKSWQEVFGAKVHELFKDVPKWGSLNYNASNTFAYYTCTHGVSNSIKFSSADIGKINIGKNDLNGSVLCNCRNCVGGLDINDDFPATLSEDDIEQRFQMLKENNKRDHEELKRVLQAHFDRQDIVLNENYELIKMMKQCQPTAIEKVSVPPRLPSLNPSTSRKTTKAASKIVMNEHKPEDDEEETQQDVQKPAPKAVQQKRRAKTSSVDKKTIEDLANIYISSQKKK